jgi:hypothetical protein
LQLIRNKDLNTVEVLCPFAIAYVQWRQFIEGLNEYFLVENGVASPKWSREHATFASFQDREYLAELIYDLKRIFLLKQAKICKLQ